MVHRVILVCLMFILISSTTSHLMFAQANATIKGQVKDLQTGEPLPSANVTILGTGLGAATDIDGKYVIRDVAPGLYTLRASYIGYKPMEAPIKVGETVDVRQDFGLEYVGIKGKVFVVTAQAGGQMQAINKQLAALPVMNVVSAARIQELPDANAAESVSRLPGVSLVRTGGEGSKVVIRGLSPQFNQVTIDGVELPSDVASANNVTSGDASAQQSVGALLGDRAEDLSMISSSMLGGIEVIKAITPDMDATLIGGVVNFGLRKATKGLTSSLVDESWFPLVELRTQGGYNNLKNTRNDYKFVGTLERRFFDESFGVFVQASTERRNLSANELGASYTLRDKTHGDAGIPDLVSLDLTDVWRKRERVGGTVVLDFQHETGEIGFMNFISSSDTKEIHRGESIRQTSNDMWYNCTDSHNKLNVLSNLLSIKQDIPLFHIDAKLSHSYSESRNPEDLFFDFWQNDAGLRNKGDLSKVHPKVLWLDAVPNDSIANLDVIQTSETFQKERSLTGSLDLQADITFSNTLAGKIKFGGMYQYRSRAYDFNQSNGSQLYSGGSPVLIAFRNAFPWLVTNGVGSFLNFNTGDYEYGKFLNGEYSIAYPINPDLMWQLLPYAKVTTSLEGYRRNNLASFVNDYSGDEKKSAAYVMFTLNVGDEITILPGARYQNLTTTYTAMRGRIVPGGIQGGDTTVTQAHGFWLPMLHLRYKPFDWLQLHFAYTNTLNYPDHSTLTPRYFVGSSAISYNNWRIKPATSENFDVVASVFMNEIGLFSVNGFKKRIKDLIFSSHTYVTDLSAYPDLPQGTQQLFEFNTYINNPIPIDLWGLETEWQTHFWYLPAPFSGIVFNINYTHIFSEASYPRSEMHVDYDEEGNIKVTVLDTMYTTRLLNQPNDILNLAIGYDYGGFSARLSLLYQDNIFKRPDFWMQNRVNSAKFSRWDLSVKQELPWFRIQLYFDLNNITGEKDIDINQKTSFPASEQHYGMTGDLGLRIKL